MNIIDYAKLQISRRGYVKYVSKPASQNPLSDARNVTQIGDVIGIAFPCRSKYGKHNLIGVSGKFGAVQSG